MEVGDMRIWQNFFVVVDMRKDQKLILNMRWVLDQKNLQ